MSVSAKLAVLADAAKYDASCASSGSSRRGRRDGLGNTQSVGICHSYTPDGRCVSLLKVLLTNICVYDCAYCVNRASSDVRRATFKVDELVDLTIDFYRRNYIEGLFLSSGILVSPDATMERLSAVAERLRTQHRFRGYIHLKAVPGASEAALEQAGRFADRLSANIELPTASDLSRLAPAKTVDDVESTMAELRTRHDRYRAEAKAAKKARRQLRGRAAPPPFAPAGQSTQMIVGATSTPDRAIISTASRLYQRHRLRRVYYSAFSPIPHASAGLPPQAPPLVREHRLYQADWLIRNYGFDADELTTPEEPALDLELDPKLTWALRHRHLFPVDLSRAPREELLRVPGLGERTVSRLLGLRRGGRGVRLEDLGRLKVPLDRTGPFVITVDPNPALRQLDAVDLRNRFLRSTRFTKDAQAAQLDLFGGQAA